MTVGVLVSSSRWPAVCGYAISLSYSLTFNDNKLAVGTCKHRCYMAAYLGVMLIRTIKSFQRIRYQLESAVARPFM